AVVYRILGVLARHWMIFGLYDGVSDAVGYFGHGRAYAEYLWSFDFSIFSPEHWRGEKLWGTQAMRYLAAFAVALVGPSVRATFLVFAMAAFTGLTLVLLAAARASQRMSVKHGALLLWFWPTLWFWPSSGGKEAVMLFGLGLAVYGYVGTGTRPRMLPLLAGLGVLMMIRPHVAGVA